MNELWLVIYEKYYTTKFTHKLERPKATGQRSFQKQSWPQLRHMHHAYCLSGSRSTSIVYGSKQLIASFLWRHSRLFSTTSSFDHFFSAYCQCSYSFSLRRNLQADVNPSTSISLAQEENAYMDKMHLRRCMRSIANYRWDSHTLLW